jgi:hypothetical protein
MRTQRILEAATIVSPVAAPILLDSGDTKTLANVIGGRQLKFPKAYGHS